MRLILFESTSTELKIKLISIDFLKFFLQPYLPVTTGLFPHPPVGDTKISHALFPFDSTPLRAE